MFTVQDVLDRLKNCDPNWKVFVTTEDDEGNEWWNGIDSIRPFYDDNRQPYVEMFCDNRKIGEENFPYEKSVDEEYDCA